MDSGETRLDEMRAGERREHGRLSRVDLGVKTRGYEGFMDIRAEQA